MPIMNEVFPIIGMSPGNSYFKDKEVSFLLEETIRRFGRTAILVADVPAIATYEAFGYSTAKARAKAVLKGNNLKNRTRKIQKELGLTDAEVRIIDWVTDVASRPEYEVIYERVKALYEKNTAFMTAVDDTTRAVLEHSGKNGEDIQSATKKGVHYLLSELAFLEFAPIIFASKSIVYVYHKNWPVYENYVAGKFDGKPKMHLDFLLLENPSETYKPLADDGVKVTFFERSAYRNMLHAKQLRGAFSNYPPAFMHENGVFSGIFYELIKGFADHADVALHLTEETGYGVIVDGLNEGRFDVFCSAVWPTPERLKQADFSVPLYYSDAYLWVREGNSQFDLNLALRDSSFRIAIKENDISDSIAKTDFPLARKVRVPQLSDTMKLLEFVSQDKADVTFAESYLVRKYNESGAEKLVSVGKAVREYANTFMFRKGDMEFKKALDDYLSRAIASGTLLRLIEKYAGSEVGFKLKDE